MMTVNRYFLFLIKDYIICGIIDDKKVHRYGKSRVCTNLYIGLMHNYINDIFLAHGRYIIVRQTKLGEDKMNEETNKKSSYIKLISSMIIVGTIGIFRKHIPLSSGMLAFLRGLIGGLSLCFFLLLQDKRGQKQISIGQILGFIVTGTCLGINWILLFEAYDYTTVATATLCYYLEPTIVIVLSPLVFKEKLTAKKFICAVVAVVGMFFVSDMTNAGGIQFSDLKGIGFGIGAACFYASVVILNKKVGTDVDVYPKTVIQLFSAAFVLLPYLLATENFRNIQLDGSFT